MATDRHAATISPEEEALFLDVPIETPLFGHRKPTSLVGSVLYCILLAGYVVLAAASPWVFRPGQDFLSSALCSCSVALLIATGIFQQYLVYQVQKIRLQGYYVFSQKLKHLVRLPFATTAYATAAILLIMVWKPLISLLAISLLLRIIMLVEAVFAAFFMSVYMGYIHRYNSLDSQPDVLKSLNSPLQPSSSSEGLRYRDGGRLADQQMALLQYQQENLHLLCEEIIRLQECLSKYESCSDGTAPQVDLAHLLAARDQELRTLSAEMNQLKSELTLARSLIAERDSELQRVRTTNNQYVEENERLRAILAEWSNRAAKLERAFEAERISNLELQKKLSTSRYQRSTKQT
ncbi:protein FIP1-like isoform X2 [Impatiens glandulifera]|uniref:protein FIP1-like isoform X2 n=1 Tax=Impatiens glandulifera TaxID=253017 RepID=UPI001FB09B6C|nr:protein FIP1-like isoform X2 [Impatiens glandulifera]